MSDSKSDDALSRRMREEWDRRIGHDYRYWMSDGVKSDETMWEVGERDFNLLTEEISRDGWNELTALELGCGVGRIMRATAKVFRHVIGVDVSNKAVEEATRLLADVPNAEIKLGNGIDLNVVDTASIDFAYSFAALSSMPAAVTSAYLLELSRVLKLGGVMSLQVYVGKAQDTVEEDTIAIRSYEEENLRNALSELGFTVHSIKELILPFEISDHQEGLIASIVIVQKDRSVVTNQERILSCLLPGGESKADSWKGSKTEYCMALARAKQHIESEEFVSARKALDFAKKHYQVEITENDIYAELDKEVKEFELKHEIIRDLDGISSPASGDALVSLSRVQSALGESFNSSFYEQNLNVIKARFPHLYEKLNNPQLKEKITSKVSESGDPVLYLNEIALDQEAKPRRAGEAWSERAMNTSRTEKASSMLVGGFAGGYHVEALLKLTNKPIYVFEPRSEILKASLATRDLRKVLSSIESLCINVDELKESYKGDFSEVSSDIIIHPQTNIVSKEKINELKRTFYAAKGLSNLQPSIGVVGPLYGGTLPITYSCTRALSSLKQRTRQFDMSSFYDSYQQMGNFVYDRLRVGGIENDYVELMSNLVLASVTERPVDILICLAQAPMSPKVLEELRSRGVITVMWFVEDYRRFTGWMEIAKYYDYMFVIQKDEAIELIERAGAGRAIYLPTGCDPEVHKPLPLSEEEKSRWGSEVSFVGAGYNNRRQTFATLADRDFKIWGTEWPTIPPFNRLVQEDGRRIAVEEYVKIFNSSKINLNLHSSAERDVVDPYGDFVNPRTFELAASGCFQLTDNRKYLPELFDIESEIITFSDRREMNAKIDYYLQHPEEREVVNEKARSRALKDHSYQKRLEDMLGYIYADKYEQLKSRAEGGMWSKTLQAAKPHPELHSRFQEVYERGEEPILNALVQDIKSGEGTLSETEQKILFLYNLKEQIIHVHSSRKDKQA